MIVILSHPFIETYLSLSVYRPSLRNGMQQNKEEKTGSVLTQVNVYGKIEQLLH